MPKLHVKGARAGREIVTVTPETAGWKYVGFQALRLAAGDVHAFDTAAREYCIVVLGGNVDVEAAGTRWPDVGGRASVFDERGPDAVYVPGGAAVRITARTPAEVALCSAPGGGGAAGGAGAHGGGGEGGGKAQGGGRYPARRIDAASMRRFARGRGTNTRYVCDILPESEPAEHLLVVEVVTPASHSSSYPPHKHDTDALPSESALEEIYYHRLDPPQGFAFQRVYTDDRSLDEAMAVENHDVVMVPRGYHPVCVPHGYRSYYLNVMAGPKRAWSFKNDPAHEWMLAG